MLVDDEARLATISPADLAAYDELLARYEPMYVSPTDVLASLPGGGKLRLNPGESADLVCEAHPFIQTYRDEAEISLRSILAQCGLDIEWNFVRGQMRVVLTNHGPNSFYSNQDFPLGAPYIPGTPLDFEALKAVADRIELLEGDLRTNGIKALCGDSIPGVHEATLALPVRHQHPLVGRGKAIPLVMQGSGADRLFVQTMNGTPAQPYHYQPGDEPLSQSDIQISSSPRVRLPPGIALLIQQGVRYEGRSVIAVRHVNSRLIKPHSASTGDDYKPHRIRFETYGLPEDVLSQVYVFEYADFLE